MYSQKYVKQSPTHIREMIQVKGPTSFKVRFFTRSQNPKPVWVDIEYDMRKAPKLGTSSDGAMWVPLIEAAYAQFKGGVDKLENGGLGLQSGMELLGTKPFTVDLEDDPDEVFEQLKDAWKKGSVITVSMPGHEVAVLGVDEDKEKVLVYDQEPGENGEQPGPKWMSPYMMGRKKYSHFTVTPKK